MSDVFVDGNFRFDARIRKLGADKILTSEHPHSKTLMNKYEKSLREDSPAFIDIDIKLALNLFFMRHSKSSVHVAVLTSLSERDLVGQKITSTEMQSCKVVPVGIMRSVHSEPTLVGVAFSKRASDYVDGDYLMLDPDEDPIEMKWNTSIKKIIDISTSSMSDQTSSSAPSKMLHQMASIAFSLGSPYDCVFEDSSRNNSPDLVIEAPSGQILVDVTGHQSTKRKLTSYLADRILVLNKYCFWDELIRNLGRGAIDVEHQNPAVVDWDASEVPPAIHFMKTLSCASLMNDKGDWSWIQSAIDRQKASKKDCQLFSPVVLDYFTKTNAHILSRDAKISSEAFQSAVASQRSKEVLIESSWHSNYTLKPLTWLRLELTPRSYHEDTDGSVMADSVCMMVDDDKLILSTESSSAKSSEFYLKDKAAAYLMDYRSYTALLSYERMPDKVLDDDLLYYNQTLRKCAPARAPNYYRERKPGKVKLIDHKDPTSDFVVKPGKPMTNLHKCSPIKPIAFAQYLSVDSFITDLHSAKGLEIDPFDEQVLSELGADSIYRSALQRNKIYHILNLFRKAAEALSYSPKDNSFFEVTHSQTDLKLHIYVSGSVMQVDKGAAYVSLVSGSSLIKTWLWRSADVKQFKTATARLITTTLSAWTKVPKNKRAIMMTLYSLIILENSWGTSKILKPYRYLVTGIAYGSPLVSKQMQKFNEAIDENREMVSRKMSLQFIIALLNEKPSEKGTPLLGLSEEFAGYEAFLMNLCPSSTYGKRRHQVNMLKEIMLEINLARKSHPVVLESQQSFEKLIQAMHEMNLSEDSSRALAVKMVKAYILNQTELHEKLKGRFTFTPLSVLLIFPQVRKMSRNMMPFGSAPAISELMTMKASFDPIKFSNGSALETITSLVKRQGLTTTSSLAISILCRCVDLTFRMFDKDQLGGDREISIMSAEFRILQSITESFARRLGFETGIDMLDNPNKVSLLCSAQNKSNRHCGLKETVDQTRWGPNFNTCTFAYMFGLFSRYTTEAFFPLYTCVLSEQKVFQMLPHPELAQHQRTGTTLFGEKAPYHMGQGIFHYSSSLYHSLVHAYLAEIKIAQCRPLLYRTGWKLDVNTFITSDDVAIVNSLVPESQSDDLPEDLKRAVLTNLKRFVGKYSSIIQHFGIKTSDYKNMVSEDSFEFNSIFLNKASVGSNSLKFLSSLIDPFTSGDQKRDMRKIFDSYVDGLNSSLSPEESAVIMKMNMKTRLLQWGNSSQTLMACNKIYNAVQRNLDVPNDSRQYALPILCTSQTVTRDPEHEVKSINVLPYRKYAEHKKALAKFSEELTLAETMMETELKSETLSRAKKRRLGNNRGLVLSRAKRQQSKILLPVDSHLEAITVSGAAYLSMVIKDQSENSMISDSDGFVLKPAVLTRDMEAGFQLKAYKTSDSCSVSARDLLYSSYHRVPTISNKSKDLDCLLHVGRKHAKLRLLNSSEFVTWDFMQRLLYFDEVVSNARAAGNAVSLVYNPSPCCYTSFHFPVLQENIAFMPSMMLNKTNEDLSSRACEIFSVFNLDRRSGNYACNHSAEPRKRLNYVSESLYELRPDDLALCAIALLKTDKMYTSSSAQAHSCFLNFALTVTRKEDSAQSTRSSNYISMPAAPELSQQDLADILMAAMAEEGLDVTFADDGEESAEVTDSDDDFSDFFAGVNRAIKRYHISLEVPRYMMCLGQPWFKKHSIFNANLYSMVDQGFVQNCSKAEPVQLLYSVLENARQLRSRSDFRKSSALRLRRQIDEPEIRLSALFDVKSILRKAAGATYISTVTTAGKDRLKNLVLLAQSADNLKVDQIEGMPAGVTLTDKPMGCIITMDRMLTLLSDNSIYESLGAEAEEQDLA